jgi:hypothetical protein
MHYLRQCERQSELLSMIGKLICRPAGADFYPSLKII